VRQAEQRLRLLTEEAALREYVRRIKVRQTCRYSSMITCTLCYISVCQSVIVQDKIELGLLLLASCVAGNKAFAALRLEEYQAMCLPFLSSELVGKSLLAFLPCSENECAQLSCLWSSLVRACRRLSPTLLLECICLTFFSLSLLFCTSEPLCPSLK
jgi:hypothetical protein